MRITHVFWGLSIGGIETMLVNIANCQARAGARVSVIIINDLNEPMLLSRFDQAVEVIRLGRRLHSLSPNFAFRLNAELRRLNPDAIHLHRSEISCFIARRWRSRLHSTVHGLTGGRLRRRGILGRMFPLFNFSSNGNVTNLHLIPRVFSISETVRADLLANYGIESRVVANGITTAEFLRRDGHAPGRQMKIVQVSRLDVATKGQDLLVEAAAMLPDVSVDFIGEGPGRQQLEELIARHGVGDRVRLLGQTRPVASAAASSRLRPLCSALAQRRLRADRGRGDGSGGACGRQRRTGACRGHDGRHIRKCLRQRRCPCARRENIRPQGELRRCSAKS